MTQAIHPLLASLKVDKSKDALPLSEQLQREIIGLIEAKQLVPGDPLPSSRTLANVLQLSRSTVLDAYQKLLEEGILEARKGAGTFIAKSSCFVFQNSGANAPVSYEKPGTLMPLAFVKAEKAAEFTVQESVPFALMAPDAESLPGMRWTQIVGRISKSPWLHNGYCPPGGYGPFKKVLAAYLRQSRGLSCNPEQVITVTGVQQGLTLAAQLLFKKGDKIAVEDPGFQPHVMLLDFLGLVPTPVPVTETGIDLGKLEKLEDIKGVLPPPPVTSCPSGL